MDGNPKKFEAQALHRLQCRLERDEAACCQRDAFRHWREDVELAMRFVQASHDAFWELDAVAGRFLLTASWYAMTGYAPDDFIPTKESISRLIHPEDLPDLRVTVEACLEPGGQDDYVHEHRIRCKDGSWKWLWTRGVISLRDEQGHGLRITGTVTDIDERKRAELSTKGRILKLRTVIDSMPVLIHAMDENGNFAFWNKASERLTGYSQEDILGNPEAEALLTPDPEELAQVRCHLANPPDGGSFDWPITAKDGSRHVLHWHCMATAAPVDGWARWGVGIDVTDARAAQRELAERERLYRLLADNVNDVLVLLGPDLKPVYFSPSVERFLGYTPQELIGLPFEAFLPPESLALMEQAAKRRAEMEAGGVGDDVSRFWQLEVTHKDGRRIWIESVTTPLRTEQGGFGGIVAVCRDITLRKQAEDDLRETNRLLKAVMDGSNSLILIKDRQGRYLRVNKPFAELLGHSVEDVVGKTDEDILGLELGAAHRLIDREVMESGEARLIESSRVLDGVERQFLSAVSPLKDETGQAYAICAIITEVTELRHAREALELSQAKYEMLYQQSAEGILLADDQAVIQDANPAAEAIFGYSRDEFVGRALPEFIDPADLRRDPFDFEPVLSGRTIYRERPFVHKDGTVLQGEFSVRRIAENLVQAVVRDVTERRRTEVQLRETSELLQAILDNATALVFVKDPKGRYLRVNRLFEKTFGVLEAEIMGKTAHDIFDSGTATRFTMREQRVLETGRPQMSEEAFERDGASRVFLVNRFPLPGPDGSPAAVAGIVSDITTLTQAKQELRESRERYRALYEESAEGIILADEQAVIQDVNPAMVEMLGRPRKELLGRSFYDFVAPDNLAARPPIWQKILTGEVVRSYRPLLKKTGEVLPLEYSAKNVGKGVIQLACRDVSERERVERSLRQAKEAAEAASRSKSEFLANMSHEIRTPLNGVMGMMQLLDMTRLTNEQQEYVQIASSSVKALMTVIGDILDLSKVEAGKLDIRHEPYDLPGIVNSVGGIFKDQARRKGVELDIEIDSRIPSVVLGDSARLRQVLFNLVGNAVKFTDSGRVMIRVEPDPVKPEQGCRPSFTIADTGMGIAPDRIASIFETFVQADGSESRRHQGAGLGLAIAKRLVELMGGEIEAESTPGAGSVFSFTILVEDDPALTAGRKAADEPDDVPPPCLQGLRVLLVEDDRVNQLTAKRLLEKMGHEVAIAEDGLKALAALEEASFDLVLMDIQMPEMDGLETTRRIRELEADYATIPIVAVTAHALKGDRERFIAGGMNDFIPKPVDMQALRESIERLMGAACRGE
jgi:PAS domain S-box-containing protein